MKSKSWFKNFIVKSALGSALLFTGGWAFAQPVARFSGTTLSGCAPILVHFTDESTGNPSYWKWDLGNGTISYLQHPSVTYFTSGLYSIKLLVKSAAGEDSAVRTNYVMVYAAPVVNFSASQTTSCGPLSVNFTNQSSVGNGWQWDFGDGIFSGTQSPVHNYTQTGNYNVSLKVTNSDGCTATLLKQAYISVNDVKAGFTNVVTDRCSPTKISFQNTSAGNGHLQYKWFFGNGDSSVLQHPVYTYPTGGNYNVKLIVSNGFGCVDIFSRNISVDNPVSAAFAASITTACKAPAAIQFSNQSLAGNNYYWNFGDTLLSTSSNPTHVFTDTGRFTVKLIVRNNNGCTDSLTKQDYIRLQKPFVSFEKLPDSGCIPFSKKMSAITNGTDNITNYYWNFGDGQTATAISPTHVYTSPGYYTVSLITTGISGCRDTAVVENAISAGNKPVAAFSAGIRTACAQTGISFTDLSTGGSTMWQWDFGDNTQAVEQNPKHIFTDTGFMDVQLITFNGGCSDTLRKKDYVYIKPAVAKFKYDFTCAAPFTFSFNNYSIGAESWYWDFGDNNTSTSFSPVHTYTDTGLYRVKLTVLNQTTGCNFIQEKLLKAVKITPGFFASDTVNCKGKDVRFTATISSGNASRFIWDFGDGNTENTRENTVSHIYDRTGNFTVRLITINLINCRDTVIKTNYISVTGIKAKFGTTVPVVCSNTVVLFNDSSVTEGSNTIESWQWNFGDGHTETFSAPPFTHGYSSRGNFGVSLIVTDNRGCSDAYSLDAPIAVKKVSAWFWASDTIKCTNSGIKFICPYAEPGISYKWDFGDGGTAAVQLPGHVYTHEGIYTVKLKISHIAGCEDSSVLTNYIKAEDPVARFSMSDSFRTCPPLIVQFSNQSVNAMEETWDFGDGSTTSTHTPSHFYSYPGTYTVTLTIKGRGGCSSKMQKQIVVKGPKGSLSYTPLNFCKQGEAVFTAHTKDAVSYIWDFNDGTTVINSDSVIRHQYNNTGGYVPKLLLADDNGCRVPINGSDTIHIVHLVAQFNFPGSKVCSAEQVEFVNTSTASENIVNNYWDFGDGFNANNIVQPSHDYQTPGTYYPSLIVRTANGCVDSFTTAVPVVVVPSPNAVIQSTGNGCTPLAASFSAVAANTATAIIQWQWDFGNGNTAAVQNPAAQNYHTAGNYTVTLVVTSSEGCEKQITKSIEAFPLPNLQVTGNTEICKGAATVLTATGAAGYSWSPSAGLSCAGCASTLATVQSNAFYVVTGINSDGCAATDTVAIKVVQPFSMGYSNTAKLCAGKSVSLPVTGAASYQWSPATGLDDIHSASPVSHTAYSIEYRVIGTDSKGCFQDTGFITIQVNPLPSVDAGVDKNISNGSVIDLVPVVSPDVTEVRWSPTTAVFRNSGNAVTVKPYSNTTYTVEVKNAAGCAATDTVTVLVSAAVSAGDIFIPNTFSPNGDGANEIFYPRAAVSIKINRLKILNREGVIVFERTNFYTNDTSGGWDGTSRGMKLPADVYVYIVEISDSTGKPIIIPGNISLIR